jgi:hypothetical protein
MQLISTIPVPRCRGGSPLRLLLLLWYRYPWAGCVVGVNALVGLVALVNEGPEFSVNSDAVIGSTLARIKGIHKDKWTFQMILQFISPFVTTIDPSQCSNIEMVILAALPISNAQTFRHGHIATFDSSSRCILDRADVTAAHKPELADTLFNIGVCAWYGCDVESIRPPRRLAREESS